MSRLQLSSISNYSLSGGVGASGSGGRAGGEHLSSTVQLPLSTDGDDADGSFDADDAAVEAAMLDDSIEELHGAHLAAGGRVATEIDPYAPPDAQRAAFYPSGLLGPPTSVEEEDETAAAAAAAEQQAASEHEQQHYERTDGYPGESTVDRRYDDAEPDAGWTGAAPGHPGTGGDAEAEYFEAERRRAELQEAEEEAAQRDLYDGQETPGRIGVGRDHRRARKRNRDTKEGGDDDDAAAESEEDDEGRRNSEPAEDDEQQSEDDDAGDDGAGHDRHKRRRRRYADEEGSGSDSGSDRDDYIEHDRRSGDEQDDAPPAAADDPSSDDAPAMYASTSSYLPPPAASAHAAASQFANYSPATPVHSARSSHSSTGLSSSTALLSSSNYAPTTPAQHHHQSAAGAYPMQSPSSSSPHHAAAASSYAYSSPHHSTFASYSPSPHHHFGPTSPRIGAGHWGGGGGGAGGSVPFGSMSSGASSPRQDTIASVTHRVEQLARSGRLASMLQMVARSNAEAPGAAAATAAHQASLVPDYAHMLASSSSSSSAAAASVNAARSSSKSALISIDQHLLRRYMLAVLDSDMIVRGVVYNKSASMGLVINIAEILWPQDKATEVLTKQQQAAQQLVAHMQATQGQVPDAVAKQLFTNTQHFFPPLSSFLGGINPATASAATAVAGNEVDGTYATERALFANFEVLAIHGECHLAEMQAPLLAVPPAAASAGSPATAAAAVPASVSLDRFSVGDCVHALVISVDVHSEKVYLSMNQNRLRGNVANLHKLGVVNKEREKDREREREATAAAATAASGAGEKAKLDSAAAIAAAPLPPPKATSAPPLFSEATFSALLTKLKPDLQDRILAYGAAGSGAAVPASGSSATAAPTGVAGSAYGSYLASKGVVASGGGAASGTGSQPPVTPHMLKSRSAKPATNAASSTVGTGVGGSSSGGGSSGGLTLLANPLLITRARSYLTWLQSSALFKNPQGLLKLERSYHVHSWGSLLRPQNYSVCNSYRNLRYAQNQNWAKESVVKGISLAKKGSFPNALKCYAHALNIEPNFTQAFVARGAAYVLQGLLEKAIVEFEQALAIDPEQPYALTYLQAAREKLLGGKTNTSGGVPPDPTSAAAEGSASAATVPHRSGAPPPPPGSMQRGVSASNASAAAAAGCSAASASSESRSTRDRERDRDRDCERDRDRDRERSRSSRKKSHRKDDDRKPSASSSVSTSSSSSKRRPSSSHRHRSSRSHSSSSDSAVEEDSEAEAVAALRASGKGLQSRERSSRSRRDSKKRHKKDRKKSTSSSSSSSRKGDKKKKHSDKKKSSRRDNSSSKATNPAAATDLIVVTSSSSSPQSRDALQRLVLAPRHGPPFPARSADDWLRCSPCSQNHWEHSHTQLSGPQPPSHPIFTLPFAPS